MRNGLLLLVFTVVLPQIIYKCNCYKVLGLFPLPIKSHHIFFEKFMKELANRGHEVHVVSHFPQDDPVPNYHDINITGSLPSSVSKISLHSIINRGILGKVRYIVRTCGSEICEYLFKHPSILSLKNSNIKFDLVIAEVYGTDCLLYFAHHFGVPIIGISGTDLLPWAGERMGNPDNPSHIPNYFLATNDKMVIYEKLAVLGALLMSKLGYFLISTASAEMRAREFFGKHIPPLDTVVSNTSLLLVNSHLSVNIPRPLVPGIIEVGGLHIEPPKPLSPSLDKIVQSTKDGVIYFSLGTAIDLNTIDEKKLQIILNAFSKMPQTIIWSGVTKNIATIPGNIVMLPWVEQLDLLCHPKLKVFVTHGGLMSLQEAAYCATPILGIPIFPNHERHINKYVNIGGGGLSIHYNYLNEYDMINSLNNLTTNTRYKKCAMEISKIFRERPMSAMDTAIYWTEYVVKFGGARHLKTKSSELVWFQYYLVDCIIILGSMGAFMLLVSAVLIHLTQNYFDDFWFYKVFNKSPNEKDDQTQMGKETNKTK